MYSEKLKITARDGSAIQATLISPSMNPKGVLIICHGFGEHTAMYQEVADVFAAADYASILYDQRGHGERCDSRAYGIIPGYDSFLQDIDAVKKEAVRLYQDTPLILYGHSMGGNIAVGYLLEKGQEGFAAAVLESPWLRLYRSFPRPVVFLARTLGKISPKLAIVNKLNIGDISRDTERTGMFEQDPLYHNRISFRMFTGIHDAGERAIKDAGKLTIPVWLASAGMDKIVSSKATREFGDRANANVVFKQYEAYHSIHNDIVREDYYRDVTEFLDSVT